MWTSEEALVDAFVEALQSPRPRRRADLLVWREVRTQYGRPDVVAVEYTPAVVEARRRAGSATHVRLSTKAAYAMAWLAERRWMKAETLRFQLSFPNAAFDRTVSELRDRGLILTDGQLIRAVPRMESLAIRRLWVYEAKLENWSVAVNQAERHLWFTYDSYILLPEIRGSTSVSDACRKRGVGLATYGIDHGFQTTLRSQQQGFANSPLLWLMNEAVVGGTSGAILTQ